MIGTQNLHQGHSRLSRTTGGFHAHVVRKILLLGFLCVLTGTFTFGLSSCSRNAATGEEHINLVSQAQEIQMGQQADSQVIATMGLYPDDNLQRWIQQFGTSLAKSSERPNLPWTFRVVDDPVVNAFAIPGGFIYVTRGLMEHVENEAQLAGVVGHEIGHVAAQHSVHQMSTQELTQLGVAAGMMIKPGLQQYGQLIGAGLNLLFLKFSRNDEKQADNLGLRYMTRGGYDPQQMTQVMEMLDRVSKASGGGRVPDWLATHPNPGNRKALIERALDSMGVAATQGGKVEHDQYLSLIDGMVYGDNPREGFFRDGIFYQPDLRFQLQFPQGWQTVNQKQAVVGVTSNQDAILQVSLVPGAGSDQDAANKFFNQQGLQASQPQSVNLNGLSAVSGEFRANTQQGVLHGMATFVAYGGNVYQLLGYTTDQLWPRYQQVFASSMHSFSQVNDPRILGVEPMRLKIVRLNSPATIGQLARQYNSPAPVDKLALVNEVDPNGTFNAGDRVKVIVGNKDEAGILSR